MEGVVGDMEAELRERALKPPKLPS